MIITLNYIDIKMTRFKELEDYRANLVKLYRARERCYANLETPGYPSSLFKAKCNGTWSKNEAIQKLLKTDPAIVKAHLDSLRLNV